MYACFLFSCVQDVVVAFDVARRTYRRILLNFGWAYGYNVVSCATR
jgi:cation transport ATPase